MMMIRGLTSVCIMENLTIYDVVNIISKTKVDFHCEENCDS